MSKACHIHTAASHTDPDCPMCNPKNLTPRAAGFYDGQSWEQARIIKLLESSIITACRCMACRRTKEIIEMIKGE